MRLTERLVAAGAECVVVTSIAGHFCIDQFKALSPLPVVDMISEVNRAIEQRGLKRIGILGTRTAMETRFYGGVPSAQIIPPDGQDLDDVHQAYIDMATAGVVTQAQREVFNTVSRKLLSEGKVEAIMLGGTDLTLPSTKRMPTSRLSTAQASMPTQSLDWRFPEVFPWRKPVYTFPDHVRGERPVIRS